MEALISGQAGIAVCIQPNRIFSVDWNAPDIATDIHEWEIPLYFGDAPDVISLEIQSIPEVIQQLELAWRNDRGLQLTLLMLEPSEEHSIRQESAECLNELFLSSPVKNYVLNHLYSSPLPEMSDLDGALLLSKELRLVIVIKFLNELASNQQEVGRLFTAWENLSPLLFESFSGRARFRRKLVRHGAFRIAVEQRDRGDLARLTLLSDPEFRGDPKSRDIFQKWLTTSASSRINVEQGANEEYDGNSTVNTKRVNRHRRSGYTKTLRPNSSSKSVHPSGILERVERQKDAIKRKLAEGSRFDAGRYIDQLISRQHSDSKPEHRAKTLCDIAQFAKDELGAPDLQLELALRAISEAPEDGWSYTVAGDAYRTLQNFTKALEAYNMAETLTDGRIAKLGKAAVLKDIGQIDEALAILRQCADEYPEDSVAITAQASFLADIGRLGEALESYNTLIREGHITRVSLSGRAQVLRSMGNLEEALREFGTLAKEYPHEKIIRFLYADTLRDLSRFDDAARSFSELMASFPLAVEPRLGYAKALRDQGNYSEAVRMLKEISSTHPTNFGAASALAETLKRHGDLDAAIVEYKSLESKFPGSLVARNGIASIQVIKGEYKEALSSLPTNLPATSKEWVAYHIRGMAELRAGNTERAEAIFEWGIKENPWGTQRQYSQTALACLRLEQKMYTEALALAASVWNPSIASLARLVEMHAAVGSKDNLRFQNASRAFGLSNAPIIQDIRSELLAAYQNAENSEPFVPTFHLLNLERAALLMAV